MGGKPKWLALNFGYHDVMHTCLMDSSSKSQTDLVLSIAVSCHSYGVVGVIVQ